jgi:hypothetical protein
MGKGNNRQDKARRIAERKKMLEFAKEIAGQIITKYPDRRDRSSLVFLIEKIMDIELFVKD